MYRYRINQKDNTIRNLVIAFVLSILIFGFWITIKVNNEVVRRIDTKYLIHVEKSEPTLGQINGVTPVQTTLRASHQRELLPEWIYFDKAE